MKRKIITDTWQNLLDDIVKDIGFTNYVEGMLKLVRIATPNMIANKVFSVRPMAPPTGKIHYITPIFRIPIAMDNIWDELKEEILGNNFTMEFK
jgi:hypothetical protein